MNILVTGGAGFIGYHISKKLHEMRHTVTVIDSLDDTVYGSELKKARINNIPADIDIFKIDISDLDKIDKFFSWHDFDAICHLAALPGVKPSIKLSEKYLNTNIVGTDIIFKMAAKYRIPRVVYASSSSVYGENSKADYSKETDPTEAMSPYAMSKIVNELQAGYYSRKYSMITVGLRFFTVYGPWGRPDMALFKFTESILKGETIKLHNGGQMMRDFTYIDDIVDGIVRSLFSNELTCRNNIFNLGNSNPVMLHEFVSVIEKTIGKKALIELDYDHEGEALNTMADIGQAISWLNYDPKVKIQEGIPKFWEWYKKYYETNI